MREKDRRALYLIAFAALALVALVSWDRLKAAFFSPQGIMLRALPGADASQEGEEKEGNTIQFDAMELDEDVNRRILFELLDSTGESNLPLSGQEPRILIYHTHFSEAYLQTVGAPYKQTTQWRTEEEENNITAVGEELARILTEEYNIPVLHDKTNYEPPRLGTSYERSVKGMEAYREQYPSINLYIDIHRDSYQLGKDATMEDYAAVNDAVVIDGKKCARLMFVVGTGEGKTGQGFSVKPNYKQNYAFALQMTNYLNGIHSSLTRPIRVKTGRYNQHVGNCVLVEVGHNANTLEEAKNAMAHLAAAIAALDQNAGE